MREPNAGGRLRALGAALALLVGVVAGGTLTAAGTVAQDGTPATGTGEQSEFFVREDFEEQLRQREIEPEGPADQPWIQAIEPEYRETAEYQKEGPHKLCFSNAGVNNPWRVVGWTTMQAEVDLHQDQIAEIVHVDAEGSDEKQIADIEDLLGQDCDLLIVSPNTTAALTPAVEQACEQVPVIVFDRGVNTDCPVTFIKPIGGYAFGADAAEFLVESVEPGGNILALRILPGVDVLETRWSAAKEIFDGADLNVVGVEFTEGDVANTKSVVTDYIDRYGTLDGVWMDAGATSVGAIEAFEDAGLEVPPITGEDQQDFLRKWKDDGLTAVAPTYPTYQWRTPIIAALQVLNGEQVPREWTLPQPAITDDTLDQYLQPNMPPLHYALCGCEEMPGFPERWGGE